MENLDYNIEMLNTLSSCIKSRLKLEYIFNHCQNIEYMKLTPKYLYFIINLILCQHI